ncbi:hypothetical protein EBR66_07795 [bacterium]|nr:hypothetical protein [bacterium]
MPDLKIKVGVDKSGLTTGLAAMENSVKGFANKVGGILAGAFAFDKIIQGFSNAIDKGDQLQDLANRFGVAASSLQEIGNAASTSGAGLEDVASAMNKLAKNAGAAIGGNEQMAEAFNKIGLSVEQLQGMTPQDLFMALSKAIASGTLGMQDFTIAQELAGKGAAVLMETLRMGPEAIAANGQAMGVFSNETIAKLAAASDALKAFQNVVTIVFGTAVAKIMDAVEAYARFAAIRPLIKFFDETSASTTGANTTLRNRDGSDNSPTSDSSKTAGKYKSAWEQTQKTYERADEIIHQNYLNSLSDEDKLIELLKEEATLREKISKMAEGADRAAATVEIETLNGQIDNLRRTVFKQYEMEMEKKEKKGLRLQDLLAKESGRQAETALLQSRAQEAAKAFEQMPSTDTATALAEARGALKDALVQQIKDQPGVQPKGFAESEAQRKLAAGGLAADLSGFAQKSEQFRPLEKLPDMANHLVAASKTLDQILEEIRKGDGSVFR